jgi:hypothetical protein
VTIPEWQYPATVNRAIFPANLKRVASLPPLFPAMISYFTCIAILLDLNFSGNIEMMQPHTAHYR